MSVMVLDAGNSIIKAKIARRECGEVAFPHALKPLTGTEYANVKARASATGPPLDYVCVNGQPFVVGASAERHGVHIQRTGAARYSRDYYGVLAAAALGRLYERSREVSIFGSHPPSDRTRPARSARSLQPRHYATRAARRRPAPDPRQERRDG